MLEILSGVQVYKLAAHGEFDDRDAEGAEANFHGKMTNRIRQLE